MMILKMAAASVLVCSWTMIASQHISESAWDDSEDECTSLLQQQTKVQIKDETAAGTSRNLRSLTRIGTEQSIGVTAQSTSAEQSADVTAQNTSNIHDVESFHSLLQAESTGDFRREFSSLAMDSSVIQRALTDHFNWPDHIFGQPKERHAEGMWANQHGLHDHLDWLLLFAFVVVMILLEIFVIRPWFAKTSKSGLSRTLPVVFCWVCAALLFNLYIGMRHGTQDGVRWMNGYMLEWLLSMDNIFLFHLVFKLYKTPATLHPKALFWGVFGALIFRMLFFVALNSLLEVMHFCRYIFGAFLVWSGFQALRADDEDEDLAGTWPVRLLSWLLNDRLLPAPHYDMQGRLWVTEQNKDNGASVTRFSMLLPCILCLELTDLLFAVDSVSAKVGQIPDQFVAYSSSVFAIFGLRALFFILEDLVNKLRFLKYGLCFILVFIGIELMLAEFIELPATVVCLVLCVVFVVCAALSLLYPEPQEQEDKHGDNAEPEVTPQRN